VGPEIFERDAKQGESSGIWRARDAGDGIDVLEAILEKVPRVTWEV